MISGKKSLSRRDFVKGAAVTVAAVAGGGILAGCGGQEATQAATVETDAAVAAVTSAPVATEAVATATASPTAVSATTASIFDPPSPVDPSEIVETVEADVVVIGAGASGIFAATTAAEAGAKVVVIEQAEDISTHGGAVGLINTSVQKELGIEFDTLELLAEYEYYSGNRVDYRIMRDWANNGGTDFEWLKEKSDKIGVTWSLSDYPAPKAYDISKERYKAFFTAHASTDWYGVLTQCRTEAEALGAEFRFSATAKYLLQADDGRVNGVIAQNADGGYVQFNAGKGVILATGDYGHNKEMREKYIPYGAYMETVNATGNGDGHRMGMWVGGVMEMGPHAPMSHGSAGPLGATTHLQVNKLGERFQNEDCSNQAWTNQIENQPGKTAFQVFDSKWQDQLSVQPIGLGGNTAVTDALIEKMANAYTKETLAQAASEPTISGMQGPAGSNIKTLTADTLEDLAEMMGVPVDTFVATVKSYNEMCAAGVDTDFGKRADRLFPVDTPPYFAGEGAYMCLVIMGGLNCSTKMEVLDENWSQIPGLYAAGNVVGNRYKVDYSPMFSGLSHGLCLTTGRAAGASVAAV